MELQRIGNAVVRRRRKSTAPVKSESFPYVLTGEIRGLAVNTALAFIDSLDLDNGFRGAKFSLSVDGWFIHVDFEGKLGRITYEKDGIVVSYNP